MIEPTNLEAYLSKAVENIVKGVFKASLNNPRESIFMARYSLFSKEAAKLRKSAEENGEHIPPFLIASITSSCNLHCAGCYSRSNNACVDHKTVKQLGDEEWLKIFKEAKDMGISFILLAGGEPLIRKDVLKAAAKLPEILFPIFTNGTMIDDDYISLFDKYRNLVPVLSVEGGKETTENRRGIDIYEKLLSAMDTLNNNKILYGASVTVTTSNLQEVTSQAFINNLYNKGCKIIFYVEYVPVDVDTTLLAPTDQDRQYLMERIAEIRRKYEDMILIAFPGDEKNSGGCLAAGRGFFHINSQGGAEPCPFSPYSDINVIDTSLKEAMHSRLFVKLKENNVLMEEHSGGCVLFEQKELVEELLGHKDSSSIFLMNKSNNI